MTCIFRHRLEKLRLVFWVRNTQRSSGEVLEVVDILRSNLATVANY